MISTVFRTVILYFIVTVAIRLMGKRQIGDMQPNELVITLIMSEIAAIPLQDMNQPVLSGVTAIFTLVILEIFISIIAMKNFFIRKIMSGQSVVVIKNGVIDQKAMQNVRMTVLDLLEMLRAQNVFHIEDVCFAVLEVNGNLSVLLNKEAQTVTNKDVEIDVKNDTLPLPVISDGKIITTSLKALEISKNHLYRILDNKKILVEDIFLMTLDREGNKRIILKGGNI